MVSRRWDGRDGRGMGEGWERDGRGMGEEYGIGMWDRDVGQGWDRDGIGIYRM